MGTGVAAGAGAHGVGPDADGVATGRRTARARSARIQHECGPDRARGAQSRDPGYDPPMRPPAMPEPTVLRFAFDR